jgi:hypothetical protein
MKPSLKVTPASATPPQAVDTLVGITEAAIAFRFAERTPTLADVARVVSAASRVMHIRDREERVATENAAVITLAKKRLLVS